MNKETNNGYNTAKFSTSMLKSKHLFLCLNYFFSTNGLSFEILEGR